ncbi:MAG: cytochrome c4 [Xanthomonadales bacterium]|nr:cytochrome c4 [Xanthomonadales bacterium]
MNKPRLGLTAILILAVSQVFAQGGDPEAGQTKAVTCVACHGQDGNSISAEWPNLAGQHASYLARQLTLYRSGERQNAIMLGMVAALSDQDILDLAAFYAAKEVKPGVADDALIGLGQQIYQGGNAANGVPACMACHGPSGKGNPASGYPALAGQKDRYTATVLAAFKNGAVWGKGDNANAVMAMVAKNLTEEEIEAVSSYIQGLH